MHIVLRSRPVRISAKTPTGTCRLGGSILCIVVAAAMAGGCGSSEAPLRAQAPAVRVSVTPSAASLLSHDPAYRGATGDLCAAVPELPQLDSEANPKADANDVLREKPVLERLRGALLALRVPPTEQGNLKSYLTALGYELRLDVRIPSDQEAEDDEDESAAVRQHTDNSIERRETARKLGIRCLVQLDAS